MTVGIICLDGLDHRLASKHGLFEPVSATMQPLVNDLTGENRLYTPRVWNSLFLGRNQQQITDWMKLDQWEEATSDWNFIWDTVVNTSCLNLKVARYPYNQNACIPDNWVPAHGSFGNIRDTTMELIEFWNDTLELAQPPLIIGYWKMFDAYGHLATKAAFEGHDTPYTWMRDRFWDLIDLPERWLVMSDHGFIRNPSSHDERESGRKAHTEHGCAAATFDLPRWKMSEFIPNWQDLIIEEVRTSNLEELGYQ